MLASKAALSVAMLLGGIQLIPARRDNPPTRPSDVIYASEAVPPAVHSVIERSCNNCHSNQTTWPWYTYVAPFSWIAAGDVHKGRSQLNFSQWNTYSAKKKEQRKEQICEQVINGDMPDAKYLLIHRKAKLTEAEREAVCQWADASR
jgi:hypothetical protein